MTTTAEASSQLTADNRSVEVDGDSFVYRRFGRDNMEAPPLLCLQHFRGNLDSWDPALVDRVAAGREVILLDNRGVGGSTGKVPDNVTDMARDALLFTDALELGEVDLLGFSIGGYIAQEIALLRPRLVRLTRPRRGSTRSMIPSLLPSGRNQTMSPAATTCR